MKPITLALVAGTCLALGACSDEPSESAMRQATTDAFVSMYQGQAAAAAFLIGSRNSSVPPVPAITAFRKVGCMSAQPKLGHTCEFEIALNGVGRGKSRGRFYTGPSGGLEMAD